LTFFAKDFKFCKGKQKLTTTI